MKEVEIKDASVLPVIFDDGSSIVCTSIAGGARFIMHMPQFLTLTRTLSDGTEHRAEYILRVSSLFEPRPTCDNPPQGEEEKK